MLSETNIAALSRVKIEIGATQQVGHLSLLRNVHTTDSSLLCYVTGYPRRLKLWEQLAQGSDTICGVNVSSLPINIPGPKWVPKYQSSGMPLYDNILPSYFFTSDSHLAVTSNGWLIVVRMATGNNNATVKVLSNWLFDFHFIGHNNSRLRLLIKRRGLSYYPTWQTSRYLTAQSDRK